MGELPPAHTRKGHKMMKKEFSKIITAIRNERGEETRRNLSFPKAMMTAAQMEKHTATVNCGGEWGTAESTKAIAEVVMNDERFVAFLEKYKATATVEINNFKTYQIRITY